MLRRLALPPLALLLVLAACHGAGTHASAGSGAGASTSSSAGAGGKTGTGGAVASVGAGGDAGSSGDAGDGAAPPPRVLGGFFPIGAWYQPTDSFAKWASRGVNTMVWSPPDQIPAFDAAAQQNGLRTIRLPQGDGAADVGNASLLAWAQPDEPDGKMYSYPFSQLASTYAALKKLSPSTPVYLNFAGENVNSHFCYVDGPVQAAWPNCYNGVTEDGVVPEDPTVHYMTTGDVLAMDIYPFNSFDGTMMPMPISILGQTLDTMARLQHDEGLDAPQLAFIESSNQAGQSWARAPTADELRGEIWEAIAHGARGVVFFPNVVPNTSPVSPGSTQTVAAYAMANDPQQPCAPGDYNDGTPCAVAGEMKTQAALLTSLAGVLQGPIDPAPASVQATAPFEVTWRVEPGETYVFVLNLSSQASGALSLPIAGLGGAKSATVENQGGRAATLAGGVLSDTPFGAYEVRVYVVK